MLNGHRGMFGYYVRLRLRSGGRLLKELGIVRSVLLVGLLVLAVAILCKVKTGWMLPVACLLVIGAYHQARKDREFLRRFTDNVSVFFCYEYLLLSLPFAVIAGIRGEWLIALCMPLGICLLPFVPPVRFRITPIRFGFLYAGNMEYLRMFRRMSWLYLIVIGMSALGCLNGNVRVAKVGMLVWGIIQSGAYSYVPDAHLLQKFKSYHILQRELWKANSWNASVLFLPFGMMCLAGGFRAEDVLFFFSCLTSGILYLQSMALFRWVCPVTVGIAVMQLAVCILLFAWTCFAWVGCLAELTVVGILSYAVWIKWKAIWK